MWRSKLERGATAVEYAVLITLITITTIGGISVVGDTLGDVTEETATAIGGTATAPPEEEWDDLSSYTCDEGVLPSLYGPLNTAGNFTFNQHQMSDPDDLAPGDMVVTLNDAEPVRNWLACGGSPTLTFSHYYRNRFHIENTWENGSTEQWEYEPTEHALKWVMSEPRIRGNQLVFTQSTTMVWSDWEGDWHNPTLEEEIQENFLNGSYGENPNVTYLGKVWDEYTWQLSFGNDQPQEDRPYAVGATFSHFVYDEDPENPTLVTGPVHAGGISVFVPKSYYLS